MDGGLPGNFIARGNRENIFADSPTIHNIIIHDYLFQNIKDASEAEAKNCNYTINESKKIHNKRLNR